MFFLPRVRFQQAKHSSFAIALDRQQQWENEIEVSSFADATAAEGGQKWQSTVQ